MPYPFAADDHQTRNAEIFESAGAAKVIQQADISIGAIVDVVREILTDPARAKAMKAAAQKLAVRDSAERIATIVEEQGACVVKK